MANLQIYEANFILRIYPKLQLEYVDVLTAIQTEIKIQIDQSIMDRVLDYCAYENFSLDGDEH